MECIEARALKSSFLSEIIRMKSTPQASFEDLWCVAGINNVVNVNADEFSVDDLLDLSDKDFSNSGDASFEESSEEDFASVSSHDNDSNSMNSNKLLSSGELTSLTSDQLPAPIDDMESLEWLSQIVDDSVSELPEMTRFEPVFQISARSFTVLGLPYPVPKKSRTENSRKPGRVWSSSSRSLTESSTSSSSSHDSSVTSPMLLTHPFHFIEFSKKPPTAKKQRKNPVCQNGSGLPESTSQRRCTHCQVQKTPQWRTGPLGPKTLCNACGVRFKSGRLFPEYRPACSPTFSGEVHSNSHRKVLEMRKMKETDVEVEPVEAQRLSILNFDA